MSDFPHPVDAKCTNCGRNLQYSGAKCCSGDSGDALSNTQFSNIKPFVRGDNK